MRAAENSGSSSVERGVEIRRSKAENGADVEQIISRWLEPRYLSNWTSLTSRFVRGNSLPPPSPRLPPRFRLVIFGVEICLGPPQIGEVRRLTAVWRPLTPQEAAIKGRKKVEGTNKTENEITRLREER
jgi:hypothetical protein